MLATNAGGARRHLVVTIARQSGVEARAKSPREERG